MANYSIKDLERITGIKAHTIRIWEKRYGIVEPGRTDSNIRYYCDTDLKKLLNIAILLDHGYKISKLAAFSNHELSTRLMEVSMVSNGLNSLIENLILAMINLDENKFEKAISSSIIKEGFDHTIFNIIYPFFERVGILWQVGSIHPSQEHFITNLIKQKIYMAIDSLPLVQKPDQKKLVLFLPEWEMHEVGMLAYVYLLKNQGHKVIYLGQCVPADDLEAVKEMVMPHCFLTSFTTPLDKNKLMEYILMLSDKFKDIRILFTGRQTNAISEKELPSNVAHFNSAVEFKQTILETV
jgi:DNA-binding transcriptional MerR regulator